MSQKTLSPADPAGAFIERAKQEQHNLKQMLTHNPPEHIESIAAMFDKAKHVLLIAEGYAEAVAELTAQQLRHRGISAEAVADDPVKKAATLMNLKRRHPRDRRQRHRVRRQCCAGAGICTGKKLRYAWRGWFASQPGESDVR